MTERGTKLRIPLRQTGRMSANLAAVAAKLQQKDAERTVLLDEIKSLEASLANNSFGKLVLTILEGGASRGTIQISVVESSKEVPHRMENKVQIMAADSVMNVSSCCTA